MAKITEVDEKASKPKFGKSPSVTDANSASQKSPEVKKQRTIKKRSTLKEIKVVDEDPKPKAWIKPVILKDVPKPPDPTEFKRIAGSEIIKPVSTSFAPSGVTSPTAASSSPNDGKFGPCKHEKCLFDPEVYQND